MRELQRLAANQVRLQPWVGELKPMAGAQESYIETLIQRPEYHLELEHTPLSDGHVAFTVHFETYTWSPRVLRLMLADWASIRPQIDAPIFAANVDEDEKWVKFISRFGFQYFKQVIGTDGSERGLYVNF